jgi:hypothetical protein
MSDDPRVSIGFFNMPIVTTNFSTDKKGGNHIAANYIKFCNQVFKEASHKLCTAAEYYFAGHGVVVDSLTEEEMMNYIKQMQLGLVSDTVTTGVVTPEGKVIEDEHAVEALAAGKSINN